ncbi:MAG TPA: PVC-type heme-binding CxxCH protein [Gemmataceae bacterium]|nr:PVC-type heme-binding CxxCH protein [Gemmataceae bacterium]
MRLSRLTLPLLAGLVPALFAIANPEGPPKSDYNPPLAKASDEAQKAIPRFQLDKALQVEVWAAEPLLANPVAFAFDEKGRCFVAETFRMHHGVTDTRGHMYWLDDDLACRTVADRVAMYRKHDGKRFTERYERERERVRLVQDTTGSGKADKSTVFRDDFGRAEDGLGAGLLARKGNIYFTCIPDLWLLKETKGTGTADVKESLASGFGVHTGFIGHDLHGLRVGPDGRLYFSIGDRGLNVKTREGKHLYCPDSGAVLRCELDGSNLEIFATGLRNPQELAFDDFGNLFTVDNNSDAGDQARFVHVVEGGDSGWRMGYQYSSAMHDSTVKQGNRGPWTYEALWKAGEVQAAYVLPPLKNYSNGPSGFTAYPGVGLSDRYKGHFFLANFSGNPGASGIYSFGVKPKGASFEMTDDHKFVWNVLATDCEFGPDGAFYVSDWVSGWNITGKGRIYKVTDPAGMKDPTVAEARKLIAEGMEKKSTDELVKLLGHPHRGVRMEAQFALAGRGEEGVAAFERAIRTSTVRLARLHAVWGLGMVRRGNPEAPAGKRAFDAASALLKDSGTQVRANAAWVIGEVPRAVEHLLLPLLKDPEPSVRMHAALSLARAQPTQYGTFELGRIQGVRDAVFDMIRENDDRDPYLRHAGVAALAGCVPPKVLMEARNEKSPAVRLAIVLALRRWQELQQVRVDEIAAFLADGDLNVVAEAARAIHDDRITAALPKLAVLITKRDLPRVILYRVLNAHFLLGKPENARALAEYAGRADAPEPLRALAVKMLGDWPKPPRRDYITGLTQNLPARPREDAVGALTPSKVLGALARSPKLVRAEFVTAARKLDLKEAGPILADLVADEKEAAETRVEALRTLSALKDARLGEAAAKATAAGDGRVRNSGRAVLFRTDAEGALRQLRDALAGTDVAERQGAFALLAENPSAGSDALVEEWLDRVIAKTAPPELWLDILEAAGKSKSERIKRRLAGYENARSADPLGKYREALVGGDAARGRVVFLTKTAVECQRCHKLDGQGGEVGPPVNGAGKQTREYLLESMVLPSKAIAKGYESVLIVTLDGKSVSGVLRSEDDKEVHLMTAEGKAVTVAKADIDDRRATKSAMPDDLAGKLSKHELRDLVEFLSGLKEEWKK